MFLSGLSQSNQRNHQTQSPRQMSPRPPLIPSRSRDTNSRSRDSPNMSREQIIGESRSKIITSSLRNTYYVILILKLKVLARVQFKKFIDQLQFAQSQVDWHRRFPHFLLVNG